MTNDNDLLLLASSQNNKTFEVYIDSSGKKTLTPQTSNFKALNDHPVCSKEDSNGLLHGKNPKKVIFPNCSKASGGSSFGAFLKTFYGCTSLTSVSFPSLTSVKSDGTYSTFFSDFLDCTSLTSVSFPSLTSITGIADTYGAFEYAFQNCTSLTSVSFPSLTSVKSDSADTHGAFGHAFQNCTSLTSVSFPSLTSVQYSTYSTFYKAFAKCSPSLKVHFKKSMKGTKGLNYKTISLTSADQVVFDLP